MGKILLVKELAHYDSTKKANTLIVGKGDEAKDFVSNGYWLLHKDYLAPSNFTKFPSVIGFNDRFISSYKNENDGKEYKLDYKKFTFNEEINKYEYISTEVNIRVDKLVKEKILDKLIEEKVKLRYRRTKYLTHFIYMYDSKNKFIGITIVEQDYVK